MGKTSIGYCVREDQDIKTVNSLIMNIDHSLVSDLKARYCIHKNILAHKSREKYLETIWTDCSLVPLDVNDVRFTKEFINKNDDVIYNSTLLRIALLQLLEQCSCDHIWRTYDLLSNYR